MKCVANVYRLLILYIVRAFSQFIPGLQHWFQFWCAHHRHILCIIPKWIGLAVIETKTFTLIYSNDTQCRRNITTFWITGSAIKFNIRKWYFPRTLQWINWNEQMKQHVFKYPVLWACLKNLFFLKMFW